MNELILSFKCGCRYFVMVRNLTGDLQMFLACCGQHEKPYQNLKAILPLELTDYEITVLPPSLPMKEGDANAHGTGVHSVHSRDVDVGDASS